MTTRKAVLIAIITLTYALPSPASTLAGNAPPDKDATPAGMTAPSVAGSPAKEDKGGRGASAEPKKDPPEAEDADIEKIKTAGEVMSRGRSLLMKMEFKRAVDYFRRVIEAFPTSPLKKEASYLLGYSHFRLGSLKESRAVLNDLMAGLEKDNPLRPRTEVLLKEADALMAAPTAGEDRADGYAIGALLPLKGSYAPYGESALKGILLAAGVFNGKVGEADKGRVAVIVKDVDTGAASAEGAVKELVNDETVMAAIGPLLSANALDAAKAAQGAGLPIITLSQRDNMTDPGDFCFRNSMTPRAQAAAVAEYAVGRLGKRRFATLYPQNAYGTALSELFKDEVKRLGADLVGEASYEEGTTDWSEELKRLFGITIKKTRLGRKTSKEITQGAKIDALFVPDYHETVALMLPFIDYMGIKDVQLLGTNGWNSQRLAEAGGKAAEGAVFVDGFFPSSQRPGTKEFVERFKTVYGETPGIIEAQSYDGASLLIGALSPPAKETVPDKTAPCQVGAKCVEEKPANEAVKEEPEGMGAAPENDKKDAVIKADRQTVKTRLHALKDYTGAEGHLSFDKNGEAIKRLFVLTIKDGRIVEVDETPAVAATPATGGR